MKSDKGRRRRVVGVETLEGRQLLTAGQPDLVTTQVGSEWPAFAGSTLTYTVEVSNVGDVPATAVTLKETFSAYNFAILSAESTRGAPIVDPGNGYLMQNGLVTVDLGTLEPGCRAVLTVSGFASLVPIFRSTAPVQVEAQAKGSENDPTPSNNAAAVLTPAMPDGYATLLGPRKLPNRLVLTFAEALDRKSPTNLRNYRLVDVGKDRRVGTHDDRVIPITSAKLSTSGRQVTLRLARGINLRNGWQLTVKASKPGGLALANGQFFNGNGDGRPGGNLVIG